MHVTDMRWKLSTVNVFTYSCFPTLVYLLLFACSLPTPYQSLPTLAYLLLLLFTYSLLLFTYPCLSTWYSLP